MSSGRESTATSSESTSISPAPELEETDRNPKRPSILTILSIITGLPIALWSYKCLMMVLFQRKIIYMPYLPLGAREEKLADVPNSFLHNIDCEGVSVRSEKRVLLSGILAKSRTAHHDPDTVFIYFQGNAGTPLLLIPPFQALLTSLRPPLQFPSSHPSSPPTPPTTSPSAPLLPHSAILSVAPRSYWKSTRVTPTQRGLTTDYLHVLHYALNRFPRSSIIIFGHSLGAAAAICLLSTLHASSDPVKPALHHELATERLQRPQPLTHSPDFNRIRGLILENPFPSIPSMIRALYPQKYLPYRYLTPFAFDKWDAAGALRACAFPNVNSSYTHTSLLAHLAPDTLVIQSENDELVPREMGKEVHQLLQAVHSVGRLPGDLAGRDRGDTCLGRFALVPGALHNTAWTKPTWASEIKAYVESLRSRA